MSASSSTAMSATSAPPSATASASSPPQSPRPPIVAVIGGGQLARMMQEEASGLGIGLRALVEASDGSTGQVTVDAPVGHADDAAAVRRLLTGQGLTGQPGVPADVLTFEHEHQDADLLTALQNEGIPVHPTPAALELARDKLAMRRAMAEAGLPQPRWTEATGNAAQIAEHIRRFGDDVGWPLILKTPRGGYDGHGVLLVRTASDLDDGEAAQWIDQTARAYAGETDATTQTGGGGSLGGGSVRSLLIEQAVPFTRELAVLLARNPRGDIAVWPVVESIQVDGMCAQVLSPAPELDPRAAHTAQEIGRTIATRFDVTGVLAVELFAVDDGAQTRLYINELAMRPHNSGHWTQDGAVTSQFAQHLRAVLNLPLGDTAPTVRGTVMVNYIGGPTPPPPDALHRACAVDPEAHIHLYGKQWRARRKLGHVNLTLPGDPAHPPTRAQMEEQRARALAVVAALRGDEAGNTDTQALVDEPTPSDTRANPHTQEQ